MSHPCPPARSALACLVAAMGLMLMACTDRAAPVAADALAASTPVVRFRDGALPARQLAFSADGQLLASTNADGTINVRRVSDRHIVRTFTHANGVTSVAFAPDGRWLVTGGYDGSVRRWDMRDGKALARFAGHTGTVWSVDVAPDGERILSAGEDGIVRVWRVADATLLASLAGHTRNVWHANFSPDGARIASGGFDYAVKLWDAKTYRLLRDLPGHEQAVVGLGFSPDGQTLATGSDDSTVRLWRATDGAPVRTLANGNHVYAVAFSADGRWLAASGRARSAVGTFLHGVTGRGGDSDAISLWRTRDGALVQRLRFADDVMSVAFSPEGRWLAGASETGEVALWAVAANDARRAPQSKRE